tara:strand:+ start:1524 stop:1991 length:468 start_codon:yes stop_codon:yes gene_type:complete
MQKLTILNTREIKKIKKIVIGDFGFFLKRDYAFMLNEKNRLFVVNKDLAKINLEKLRIDKIGLYFAEYKNNQVRLSKEGAQLLFREADGTVKNVVDLDFEDVKIYFKGLDLKKDLGEKNRSIILKYKNEVLGFAKYKEGKILNFLPKIHRGEVIL